MIEFFQTRMGQRFFESTLPRLVEELARLNRNIEALTAAIDHRAEPPNSNTTVPDHND